MPPSDHDAGRGGRRGRRRAAHGLTRWIARRDSDGLCASDRSAASKPHTLASGGELPCEPHTLASGGELPCEPPPRRLEAMPCALLSRRAARPQAKGRRRRSRPRRALRGPQPDHILEAAARRHGPAALEPGPSVAEAAASCRWLAALCSHQPLASDRGS